MCIRDSSYTSFAYSGLRLSTANLARHEALALSFRVRNTGARAGRETAQVLSLIHI